MLGVDDRPSVICCLRRVLKGNRCSLNWYLKRGRFTNDKAYRRFGCTAVSTLQLEADVEKPPESARESQPAPRLRDTLRLSADGLAKVLGDLEARVMRAARDLGHPVPARAAHERITREHDVALLTVVTVLTRLVSKGLLRRQKREGILHFEPQLSEEEFRAHATRRGVEGILSLGPSSIAASFEDALAERSPEGLEELECLVRERLHREES